MYEGAIAGATSRHTDSRGGFQVPQSGRATITSHLRFTRTFVTRDLPHAVFGTMVGGGNVKWTASAPSPSLFRVRVGACNGISLQRPQFLDDPSSAETMRSWRSSGATESSDSRRFSSCSSFRHANARKAAEALVRKTVGVASGTDRERDRVVAVGRAGPMTDKLPVVKMTKRRDETRGTARHA